MNITVANFKAELNSVEVKTWLTQFKDLLSKQPLKESQTLILLPPAIYLSEFKQALVDSQVFLGIQNLSEFESGAYTGEITAAMLKGWVDYVLLGHSERRVYFQETFETLQKKIYIANKHHLKVILCAEKAQSYQGELWALAYEPHLAIGTGESANPQKSWQIMESLQKTISAQYHLYGGSVNEVNVNQYTRAGFNGVLVGKKCLDPALLLAIVSNA